MFLGLLGAGLMWMPASAILAAQMNNAAMSVQQNQGIKGTVVDATGETLIGASVKVAGTTNGAVTDIDGNFTLNCKPGATLEVSYIGYKTMTVKAANGMKIQMQEDGKALNEVVVTALGIKRDRKALGYGLEEVKGEELTKAKETNVINSLSGKVAGLVVQNTAGGASGSTRVLLRGNTEMAGNNQPLYVVDGVPLDNTNFGSAGEAGGYDLGDGISAINPDDIETMTVLKGPAASALYGSRASHGVILITTKKAEKDRISVEYNGSYTIDTQLAKWDDIQEIYGAGYNGELPNSSTSGTNASWGPKADDFMFKYFDGEERPFMMHPNNASGFFRTGFTTQNSAILSVNSGKTGMRFSVTDMRYMESGLDHKYQIQVMSNDKLPEIRKMLEDADNALTIFDVRGGYSLNDKKLIMAVVDNDSYGKLLSRIHDIDPNAFIVASNVVKVHGGTFGI